MLRVDVTHPLRDFTLSVSLGVAEGRTVAVAGRSGAGKSTLLRLIAGLRTPSAGTITLGAHRWFDAASGLDARPEARGCALLPQHDALFPHLSAWRNVAYGMRGVPRGARRGQAVAGLERFGAGALADARPAELSGGERRRVALARALAARPRVLLLDEPLTGLDAATRAGAISELAAVIAEAQTAALIVTHDVTEAALLADEVAVMERGEIVQRGTPAELTAAPATAFVGELTGASVLRGTAVPAAGGLTALRLDGGGLVLSTDAATGAAAAIVRPWDVTLHAQEGPDQPRNRLTATVRTVTAQGPRVRVGLTVPEPLVAEVTQDTVDRLGLRPGATVVACWKATATRLVGVGA